MQKTSCKEKADDLMQGYHLNGNAAEHMNLPLSDERMASGDGTRLDEGSCFILDRYRAHEDWCWRACRRVSRVMDRRATRTNHLSFDCCETLDRVN